MAFANKAVLTSFSFNYPFFLVTCQMAFSIIVLELLRLTGQTSLVRFTLSRGWMFFVPSVFYAANCVFALSALGGLNIPMYGLIKRCIPVAILGLGVFVLSKPLPSLPICLSVGTITLGCIIAGLIFFCLFLLGQWLCVCSSNIINISLSNSGMCLSVFGICSLFHLQLSSSGVITSFESKDPRGVRLVVKIQSRVSFCFYFRCITHSFLAHSHSVFLRVLSYRIP